MVDKNLLLLLMFLCWLHLFYLLLSPIEGKHSVTKPWTGAWKLKEYAPCNLPLMPQFRQALNFWKLFALQAHVRISKILTDLLMTASLGQELSWTCTEVTPLCAAGSRAEKMERVFYILRALRVNTKTVGKGGKNWQNCGRIKYCMLGRNKVG